VVYRILSYQILSYLSLSFCAPSSAPVSPLRSSLVGEGKSGFPPAGPVPPASEGGDGVKNNDILCVRP
jgi:hypothetical protein